MTVRCPSCSANLKVNVDRIGDRATAKCPACQSSVPLAPQTAAQPDPQATIVVTCQACKTRLKAPASRLGAKSSCPRCHATVVIAAATPAGLQNAMVARGAGLEAHEDSSSASTRRIDSRMLGLFSSDRPVQGAASIDLDAFLKSELPSSSPARPAEPPDHPGDDAGNVAPLLNPPVAALSKIAEEIRQTAGGLTADPGSAASPPAIAGEDRPQSGSGATTPVRDGKRPLASTHAFAESHSRSDTSAGEVDRFFPFWRGILAGGLAGLLVGGAQALMAASGLSRFLPSLPFPAGFMGVPDAVVRISIGVLLGALAGFISAAVGSPRYSDRPLSFIRCGGVALLAGLACGLVTGLATGTGVQVWPIANWMRDLLLVGLLTPAMNRLVPGGHP